MVIPMGIPLLLPSYIAEKAHSIVTLILACCTNLYHYHLVSLSTSLTFISLFYAFLTFFGERENISFFSKWTGLFALSLFTFF